MPGTRLWLWCLWLLGLGVTRVAAAECQLGTVIVASVFVTLGVVAIVLAIVLLVLWKRNRGCFICPKRTRKASSLQEEPPTTQYHVNPAFVDSDSLADAEEGIIGLTPKKGLSPEKKSPIRDGYKKTWTSFPSPDFPDGLHRQVSCGSLDDNFRHMGPEVVSVWLQSQDIIGLGFNISGNMRDGIYVSQVHNRGPAVESGKIKVGDRIVSVTIAYENIVYEDALTILSYASPYPVKVTVQKERSGSSDPHSGSSEQLKHPIYRSQSLDALQRIKDPAFRPKRSQSEMKTETRKESDKRQRPADRKSKGLSQTFSSPPPSTASSRNEVTADVIIHVPNLGHHDGQEGGWSLPGKDTVEHAAAAMLAESPVSANFQEDGAEDRRRSRLDTKAARQFADLMDQVRDGKKKDSPVDSVFQNPALRRESMSPKSVPSKPERKKKASNSSLVVFEPEQDRLEVDEVEERVRTAAATTAQALPRHKNKDNDPEPEADEEQILQSFVERNVVIDSKNIEFSLVETADPMRERLRPEDAFANVRIPEWVRPASPEQEAVEEELMEARVVTRDAQALPLPSDTRQGGNNRVPKKEEPKVRQLDDGMLEHLIAMNAFPPGTQGWVGIQAGAEKGGVYDEFVPLAMQQPLLFGNGYAKGIPPTNSTTRQPRGLAFEVRDDVITGAPINVPLHKPRNGARRNSSNSSSGGSSNSSTGCVNRTSSADAVNSDNEELRAYIVRANSMREELERQRQRRGEEAEDERHALDWSGTRLVRSGSFPEIPQDDSVSDWTDNNVIGDGDEDDSVSDTPASLGVDRVAEGVLAHSVYSAREDLTNMSDLTSSASSSRSASPAVTNGPAYVITPVLSGPAALKAGSVIDLTPHLDNNANTKSISVSASTNDDMDC